MVKIIEISSGAIGWDSLLRNFQTNQRISDTNNGKYWEVCYGKKRAKFFNKNFSIGIDKKLVEDPFSKLKDKMKDKKCKLEFKTVSQRKLKLHLKKLKKKKSYGLDGLSQENLLLGASNLLAPLTASFGQICPH